MATSLEGFPICSDDGLKEGSEIQVKVVLENDRNVGDQAQEDEYGRDSDMEKALEDQAQLIGRYEAMEKAQREWEEKFRENNSSTPVCFIRAFFSHLNAFASTLFILFFIHKLHMHPVDVNPQANPPHHSFGRRKCYLS